MNFYGAAKEDMAEIYKHLLQVRGMFEKAGIPSFFGDNMGAIGRNMVFARDQKFMTAFQDNARDVTDENKLWRLDTYGWAGRSALGLPGDFVECGVFQGFYSAILLRYLDFAAAAKRMYLFDRFSGLDEGYSTQDERTGVGGAYALGEGWYGDVRARFASYSNVDVIKGVVPDVLLERAPERIAFLHLDMNAGAAEVGALEVLFDRVVDGGLILLDDYGRYENRGLHVVLDKWMEGHGHPVLELPAGQGLVIKQKLTRESVRGPR